MERMERKVDAECVAHEGEAEEVEKERAEASRRLENKQPEAITAGGVLTATGSVDQQKRCRGLHCGTADNTRRRSGLETERRPSLEPSAILGHREKAERAEWRR